MIRNLVGLITAAISVGHDTGNVQFLVRSIQGTHM